ncbi:MAG: extracellular solute-binding protein [Fimbriimonadaceae bacterium]
MNLKPLIFASALLAIGCSGGDKSTESPKPAKPGEKVTLEFQAFKGGYDIDLFAKAAKEFEAKNPDITVKVAGDPKVWEQLRPRFISNSPPDLTFPGWGMDHWGLKEEGQLLALDEALDGKPAEGEGTWRDTFEPSLLKMGQQDGKQWVLPHFFSVMGWWYDPGVFKKHGWTPPKTWEELLVLGEKIKAAGMAPITFQGQYPYYLIDGMLLPWANSAGGEQAVKDAQNLVPGAWKSPAILRAAQMIDELRVKGFYLEGCLAMNHTAAEMEFLKGKAAMVPCGTWLKAEMANVMPKGSAMEFMLPPVLASGKGDPTALLIKIEPWMVPSKGKHPAEAIELFKYMTSLSKAKEFVEKKGTLMAIKGSDEVKLMPELVAPAKAFKESKQVYADEFVSWYPDLKKEVENALTSMLNGQLTPAEFCDRVEKKAEEIRNDSTIPKHKLD